MDCFGGSDTVYSGTDLQTIQRKSAALIFKLEDLQPEDGGSIFLRNFGNHEIDGMG
jgi:hypothetical protein